MFLGGGVDLAPEGKWKMSALYGRFLKAVEPDTIIRIACPLTRGWATASRPAHSSGGDNVDIVMFHAQDYQHSIHYTPDSLGVYPRRTWLLSIWRRENVGPEHFVLKAELASAPLPRDIRAEKDEQSQVLAKAKPFILRIVVLL